MPELPEFTAEDNKLLILARGARGRIGAETGAAVRDGDGRTYAAASVTLPGLELSGLQLAVANAVAAGAEELEAAVVVTAGEVDEGGLSAVRHLSSAAPVYVADPDGTIRE
ncbi:cytidine deaminase [Phytomonospora endophytica]|uniref:Cytidine deaminase n=1 Tax=Phytomonospora endophytica TaxID=714109 RepID=A0A841FLL5_9ACTN|nr:cytidine deaminase [Phytomonospora endophytica]MBB6034077.1 hypothetical protein [Phytomonospora endophytica]GIG66471.1 hypothetical protein Pen01_27660 [Phytomonospora endophytica]